MAVTLNSFAVEDDPDAISSLIGLTTTAERRVPKSLLKEIVQSLLAILGQPETPPNNDCDDIAEHGIYRTDSGTSNGPGAGRLVLHLEYTAESRAAQVAFSAAASSLLDVQWREKYGSGDWSSWTQILTGEDVIQSSEDTESGRLLAAGPDGYLGYFGTGELAVVSDADTIDRARRYRWDSDTSGIAASMGSAGVIETYRRSGGEGVQRRYQIGLSSSGLFFRTETSAGFRDQDWETLWHTGNTTVDGSGFLLEASPIVRIYTDEISEPVQPVGATLTHAETGVYVLSGVPPLASEGWTVRTPEDVNGNKVVAIQPPEYDAATETLTLRTHDLLWSEGRLVPGDPMDIPEGHFVMLRFHEEAEPGEPEA